MPFFLQVYSETLFYSRRTDVDTTQQLQEVVNKSAYSNKGLIYDSSDDTPVWQWRDCKEFLIPTFTSLKGIASYQHFRYKSTLYYINNFAFCFHRFIFFFRCKVLYHQTFKLTNAYIVFFFSFQIFLEVFRSCFFMPLFYQIVLFKTTPDFLVICFSIRTGMYLKTSLLRHYKSDLPYQMRKKHF